MNAFNPQATSYPPYPVTPPAYGGVPMPPPSPQYNPYDPYYAQTQRLQQMVQQQQAAVAPPAQAAPTPPAVIVEAVDNEQQAIEAAADLTGRPQLFVMRDDTSIFAKRFNVGNGKVDFTRYVRDARGEKASVGESAQTVNIAMEAVVKSFTAQLNDIQKDIADVKESLKNVQLARDSKSAGAVQPAAEKRAVSSSTNGGAGSRPVDDYGDS